MADYVDVISGAADPALVSPPAMDLVREVAVLVPALSFAGFECRLCANDPRVDLQVNLPPVRVSLPSDLRANPIWRFLDSLMEQWAEPRSELRTHFAGVFLEFDLVQPMRTPPVPSLFFSLRQGLASAIFVLDLLEAQLCSASLVAEIKDNLAREVSALPPGGELANLGVMLGRSPVAVHARLIGLRPRHVASTVGIDLSSSRPEWTEALALAEAVDSLALLVNLARGTNPTAGLELFCTKRHPEQDRWRPLLQRLVAMGSCAQEKADALLKWPGAAKVPRDRWPKPIGWGDRLLGHRGVSLFWRGINHIKVTPEPSGNVSAKAYLAFGHRWVDRRVS